MRLDDSVFAAVLPRRHRQRCLRFGTPRLVRALQRAGAQVHERMPGSPPLGVGNLSRSAGGPLWPYSKSHQSGRDADLAPYQVDADGRPVPAEDLVTFGPDLRSASGRVFDVPRTWLLVRALLEDSSIEVKWLFISRPLRRALLEEAQRQKAPPLVISRAERVLHQPSDAPPHDDHLHLRIRCTAAERALGCRD
jgi:penicillin-insensitive murein endopeptidase